MHRMLSAALTIAGGYLIGSIASAIIVCRMFGLPDPRSDGSGNPGATNVLRTGNKPLALAVLVLDAGKGAIAALLAWGLLGWEYGVAAGCAAFIGHLYPVWLRFKGGKGVATGLGTFLAISWPIFIGMALAWLAGAFLFRRSSMGALASFAVLPLLTGIFSARADAADVPLPYWYIILGFVIAAIVFYKHRANIVRIIDGTEPKISFGGGSKKNDDASPGE